MRRGLVSAALVCVVGIAGAQDPPPLEIKGVPLGSPPEAFAAAFPGGLRCYTSECFADYDNPIKSNARFGPAYITSVKAWLLNGKVESVTIATGERSFQDLAAALIEKYGKPSQDIDSPTQNRMGATFPNRQIGWLRPDGAIVSSQRSGKIDRSVTTFSTRAFIDSATAAQAAKPKQDAKGL